MPTLSLYFLQIRQRLVRILVWVTIWSLVSLLFASVFNSLQDNSNAGMATFRQMPQQVLDAINIDPGAYLSRLESFISGQFLFIYLLAGSIFALVLGVETIGRRIQNRTIADLLTKPIPRGRLYLATLGSNLTVLALSGLLVGGLSYLIFSQLVHDVSISSAYFRNLHIGSTLVFMAFAAFGQLAGALMNGGRSVMLGAGVVVMSWFINTLGGLADLPQWLQKLSVYHYFDITLLRDSFMLSGWRTAVLVGLIIGLGLLGALLFKRKNIYL